MDQNPKSKAMADTCYRQMTKAIGGCCCLSIHTKLVLKFSPHREVFRGGAGDPGEVVDLSSGPQPELSHIKSWVRLSALIIPVLQEAETGGSL